LFALENLRSLSFFSFFFSFLFFLRQQR